MANQISLLTGVPRSGTTLSCKLLNNRPDVVALHEPLDPSKLPKGADSEQAAELICQHIIGLDQAISLGEPFPHGDKGGLNLDNPVGGDYLDGRRQVVAKRGMVQLPPKAANSYHLVVKQNAMFTALLPELTDRFKVVGIVRNPVDVLLSWLSVNLPVNRGHIPAGERFDSSLARVLSRESDVLTRQLHIYNWFVDQYMYHRLPIIKYEELLSSGGAVLDNALGLPEIKREALQPPQRNYPFIKLEQWERLEQEAVKACSTELYGESEILKRLVVLKGNLGE